MISRIFIFGGHFEFLSASLFLCEFLCCFLKWCSINTFSPVGPKFRSFLASDARFPRYGGLKFRNVLSVGKIWPLIPEYSGAIGWIAYKSHSRLPPYPKIIVMLTYPVHRFKTRRKIAFSKSRKIIIISRKIRRENNSLAGGNPVQTNNMILVGCWAFLAARSITIIIKSCYWICYSVFFSWCQLRCYFTQASYLRLLLKWVADNIL